MKKLILFLLAMVILVFVSQANAQSWVLWEGTIELGLPIEWKIIAAYPKYEQCIERHKKDFEIIKKNFENMGFNTHFPSPETIIIEKVHLKNPSGDITVTHKCLPDTIDPRK